MPLYYNISFASYHKVFGKHQYSHLLPDDIHRRMFFILH